MTTTIITHERLKVSESIAIGRWLEQQSQAHDDFIRLIAPAVVDAASRFNINAIGAVAQSAVETGYGNFPGTVPRWFRNPAGLKVRRSNEALPPYDHAQFPTWEAGALAQILHLNAYCGRPARTLTDVGQWLDPRNSLVVPLGPQTTFNDLAGRWATDIEYGVKIERIIETIEAMLL